MSYAISLLPWCAKYDEWPVLIRTCICGTGWEFEPHSNDLMSNGLDLGVTVGEFHEIVSGVPRQANATTVTEVHDHTVQKMLSLGLLVRWFYSSPYLHCACIPHTYPVASTQIAAHACTQTNVRTITHIHTCTFVHPQPFLHFVFNMSSWLMHVDSFGW